MASAAARLKQAQFQVCARLCVCVLRRGNGIGLECTLGSRSISQWWLGCVCVCVCVRGKDTQITIFAFAVCGRLNNTHTHKNRWLLCRCCACVCWLRQRLMNVGVSRHLPGGARDVIVIVVNWLHAQAQSHKYIELAERESERERERGDHF